MNFIKKDLVYNDKAFYTLEVALPKTTLLLVGNDIGFIMCGALDVDIYDSLGLVDRKVVCAKCFKVKTIDDLLNATVAQSSKEATNMGIVKGMKVLDALNLLS